MAHLQGVIGAIVGTLLAFPALAASVDDCIRNCAVARGTCDFSPGDTVRSSNCREQADACRYQCQLDGPTGGNRATKFGAIAYSPSKRANGITYDFGDRASAERAALNACIERSRAGDCRVVIWFSNNCGALATASDGTYGGGYSGNKLGAESRAIQYCRGAGGRDCAIQRSFCTGR
ncbi:MAG: DUF4189 domain-containing protein [Burkholderiales bacterium]|nr:DUF4189 domain-containing protein [Burkholderiales bacterium]